MLYTSTNPGFVNIYNMYKLQSELPDNEYIVVAMTSPVKALTILQKLRRRIAELRHGKNYWIQDIERTYRKIKKECGDRLRLNFKIDYIIDGSCNGSMAEECLKGLNPDIIYQCGGSIDILKENIFTIPKIGTINVHHGFAPEIRGVYSLFWPLFYGMYDKIGVTAHFIDKNIDTGLIICQCKYCEQNLNFSYIYEKAILKGGQLLIDSIKKISSADFDINNFTAIEVHSYYFSYRYFIAQGEYKLYNKFRKNNFKPNILPKEIKYKKMTKKIL